LADFFSPSSTRGKAGRGKAWPHERRQSDSEADGSPGDEAAVAAAASDALVSAGRDAARGLLARVPRGGRRYDVPQIGESRAHASAEAIDITHASYRNSLPAIALRRARSPAHHWKLIIHPAPGWGMSVYEQALCTRTASHSGYFGAETGYNRNNALSRKARHF
jgi:hypothetical protein